MPANVPAGLKWLSIILSMTVLIGLPVSVLAVDPAPALPGIGPAPALPGIGPAPGTGGDSIENPLKENNFRVFFINIISFLLGLAAALALLALVYSGFSFVAAFGNEEKLRGAKRTALWSVTGLILIVLSMVILFTIRDFLSG